MHFENIKMQKMHIIYKNVQTIEVIIFIILLAQISALSILLTVSIKI